VDDVQLTVYLYDLYFFEEILFVLNYTEMAVQNNRWNSYSTCFQVLGRSYQLNINASSSCETQGNQAFVAVDQLVIKEKIGENLEELCKDIRITPFPDTTEPTTLETTEFTTEITTVITQSTDEVLTSTKNDSSNFFRAAILLKSEKRTGKGEHGAKDLHMSYLVR
jgi:hypothetical protein